MDSFLKKNGSTVLMAQRFVTATVAYVMLDATLGDIERALERYAEVISIKDLHVRDFPSIKNGKNVPGRETTSILPGHALQSFPLLLRSGGMLPVL